MYPKLRYIDALRGWAILLIMMSQVSHLGSNQYHWLVENFLLFGDKGIQLFFVISAFTLFASFNYRYQAGDKSIGNFYIRRFFRIAPMYYLAFAFYYWQKSVLCNASFSLPFIASGLTFTSGFSPYWIHGLVPGTHTIAVEMMFYALLPLLVFRIKNINQAFVFTFAAYLIAVVLRYFLRLHSPIENEQMWRSFLYLNFINQLPSFGVGIIAYYLVIKKDAALKPLAYLLIILWIFGCRIWDFLVPNSYFYSVAFMFAIWLLSRYEFSFFVNRFTIFVGRICYSVFLIHFAISFLLLKTNLVDFVPEFAVLNFILRYLVVLLITCPLAWLAHKYIETPARNLGEKIIE